MTNTLDGSSRLSLFLQVNSINTSEMVAACEHIRAEHRDPSKEDHVWNLVLNEVGTVNGDLYSGTLDLLAPYFPGGSRQAFDNLFVGSAIKPWTGAGNPYREGIKDGAFRWDNLVLQKQLWQKFRARYGSNHFHYVNYEAVLDYWDEAPVRSAFEAFLIQSVRDSYDVLGDRSIMWSPAIWRDNRLSSLEASAFTTTFNNVKWYAGQYGHTKGINFLHLQDMLGRSWSGNDLQDVADWYWQIAAAHNFASLRINAELFTDNYQPLSEADFRERMNFYDSQGIPVGASWELRYWFREHTDV